MLTSAKNQDHGFTFEIRQIVDEFPDTSYLGTYSDTPTDDAIKRTGINPSREYRYFIPAITEEEHYDSLRSMVNPADTRKRHYGARTALRLARSYVEHDYNRMEALNDGSWYYVGVVVTLSFDGKALGQASLWGIESDSDKTYFTELIADLKSEAYADGLATMGALLGVGNFPALESIEED